MEVHIVVFWVTWACSLEGGYQASEERTTSIYRIFIEVVWFSETSVTCQTTRFQPRKPQYMLCLMLEVALILSQTNFFFLGGGTVINRANFFSLVLQLQFVPWPTSMKLSVSLRFSRSWTVGRTPWVGDQLVARPLYLYTNTEKRIHIHRQTLNMHALSWIQTHVPGFRASEDSACLRPLGYRGLQ
jgi:hypothetical protein